MIASPCVGDLKRNQVFVEMILRHYLSIPVLKNCTYRYYNTQAEKKPFENDGKLGLPGLLDLLAFAGI
jgi:hypothetical protein